MLSIDKLDDSGDPGAEVPLPYRREPSRRTAVQWLVWLSFMLRLRPKPRHFDYSCPVCGEESLECWEGGAPPEGLVYHSAPAYNAYYAYEFGVTGYDWEEEWQCWKCGTVYGYCNSSC